MRIKKEHMKLIAFLVLIVVLVFTGKWIHKQWWLFQNLIAEKGENMEERYYYQSRYLEELEEITAKIVKTNELTNTLNEDIRSLNEIYWIIRNLGEYNRYGYFDEKIRDIGLEQFIRISNKFLKLLSQKKVELTAKNIDFLKMVNKKAKELNKINSKYYDKISEMDSEKMFYSDILAKAINEMNDNFKEYPGDVFVYEKEKK